MNTDERLTAYALNDPGLTEAERHEIEATLESDPNARRAVEETRHVAEVLSAALRTEEAAEPVRPPGLAALTPFPATPRVPAPRGWTRYVVTAIVLFGVVGLGAYGWWQTKQLDRKVAKDVGKVLAARTHGGAPNAVDVYTEPGDVENLEGGRGQATLTGMNQPLDGKMDPDLMKKMMSSPRKSASVGFIPGSSTPSPGGKPNATVNPSGEFKKKVQDSWRTYEPNDGKPQPGRDSFRPATTPADKSPEEKIKGESTVREGISNTLDGYIGGDRFPALIENGFVKVEGLSALSTFGVDVDTASYAIVRKYLTMGQLPPANAVRLEELVNYFPYADKAPDGDDPFAVAIEMADCPWEPTHRLVRLGLKAKPIANDKRPVSNLVFLIDVSGSMNEPAKLPLVKASLKLLVNQLGENDRVAMVVYAGTTGIVLDSTPGTKKDKIIEALDRLEAGGSTNGSGGIQQAYEVAAANFVKGGTNRVILCTDGDWNVGTTSTEALIKLIEQKRETGVFLSVFGFGMGNLRDEMMVKLAGKGNGNYAYIDTLREAHKSFVEQMGGTLVTVAKDVKIQIEFNPAAVKAYRLLGYEKRHLEAKDFHDDKKDAGEMGAGHVVTALYELVPAGAVDPAVGKVDGLRYQKEPDAKSAVKSDKASEAFVLKLRHKKPDSDTSTLREIPVSNVSKGYEKSSEDFRFAAAVASFAMLLRDSPYKGNSNYAVIQELAGAAMKHDPSGYRAEFVELVKKAKGLAGK